MSKTRISRGNWVNAIAGDRTKKAINALDVHETTSYEQTTAAGTATGLNGPNRMYNSTTLTAEPNLFVDVAGNTTYLIYGCLFLSVVAADNIKLDFAAGTASIVTGTMGGYARFSLANGTSQSTALTALNTLVDGGATNAWIMCEFEFTAAFANGGTVQLEFAQHTAAAAATDILPGSFLVAQPLDHVITV